MLIIGIRIVGKTDFSAYKNYNRTVRLYNRTVRLYNRRLRLYNRTVRLYFFSKKAEKKRTGGNESQNLPRPVSSISDTSEKSTQELIMCYHF